LSPRSVVIERANLKHITPYFGKMLLCDVTADDIVRYQAERLEKSAAPKTVNLEVGTLRAILRKNRLWASLRPEVRMLRASENVGRAISREEEADLLEACPPSRSRSLYPAVSTALNTCMRLFRTSPPEMGPSRSQGMHAYRWPEQNRVGHGATVAAK
jgi:hypothetical protein